MRKSTLLHKGLSAALTIQSEPCRADALATLAYHLNGAEKERALKVGLVAALTTHFEWSRAYALDALIPHFTWSAVTKGIVRSACHSR